MSKQTNEDDIFNPANKIESGRVQWGSIGDYVYGTLVGTKNITFSDGKTNKQFELLVIRGEYHPIVEDADGNETAAKEPVVLAAGDYVRVSGKTGITDEMNKIKIGQNVSLRYEKLGDKKPGKKRFKDVAVYQGAMNEEYLQSLKEDDGMPALPDILA